MGVIQSDTIWQRLGVSLEVIKNDKDYDNRRGGEEETNVKLQPLPFFLHVNIQQ